MLIRLQSGYHVRKAVPSYIRDIVGKKELWLSLGTNKREVAKPYACAVFVETERLFRSVMHLNTKLSEDENFIRDELPDKGLIPICTAVQEAELLGLAQRATNQKRHYLFHDIDFKGQDNKRSAHF